MNDDIDDPIITWTIAEICERVPDEIDYFINASAMTPPGVYGGCGEICGGRLSLHLERSPGSGGYRRGWHFLLVEWDDIGARLGARTVEEGHVTSEVQMLALIEQVVESARRNREPTCEPTELLN